MSIPNRYNFGNANNNENPDLYKQLNDIYTRLANAANSSVKKVIRGYAPSSSSPENASLSVGDVWIDEIGNAAYIMTSRANSENVNWLAI